MRELWKYYLIQHSCVHFVSVSSWQLQFVWVFYLETLLNMNNQETQNIPKLVVACVGVMVLVFTTVYVGLEVLLQFLPAAESVVG